MTGKVAHRVAVTLKPRSARVAALTSLHVIRYRQALQLRSLEAAPLLYHVTRRGFSGCVGDRVGTLRSSGAALPSITTNYAKCFMGGVLWHVKYGN